MTQIPMQLPASPPAVKRTKIGEGYCNLTPPQTINDLHYDLKVIHIVLKKIAQLAMMRGEPYELYEGMALRLKHDLKFVRGLGEVEE